MVENFQKNMLALDIAILIVGCEVVKNSGVGVPEAIVAACFSILFAVMLAGMFTEALCDGTLEEENFS